MECIASDVSADRCAGPSLRVDDDEQVYVALCAAAVMRSNCWAQRLAAGDGSYHSSDHMTQSTLRPASPRPFARLGVVCRQTRPFLRATQSAQVLIRHQMQLSICLPDHSKQRHRPPPNRAHSRMSTSPATSFEAPRLERLCLPLINALTMRRTTMG